jgi:hypothetical protein
MHELLAEFGQYMWLSILECGFQGRGSRPLGVDAEASLWYAFALVLQRFQGDLRQCQLKACGRFFLYDPSAEPRKYCRTEHREEHIEQDAANRKQARRADMSASEWRDVLKVAPLLTVKLWKDFKRTHPRTMPEKFVEQRKDRAMSFTMRLVSPARLTDAPMRVWLEARDTFLAAGGSADDPSAVMLDDTGRVREVLLYKDNAVDLKARVRVRADGKFEPVEWI